MQRYWQYNANLLRAEIRLWQCWRACFYRPLTISLSIQIGVVKVWKKLSKLSLHRFHVRLSLNSGVGRSDNRELRSKCRLLIIANLIYKSSYLPDQHYNSRCAFLIAAHVHVLSRHWKASFLIFFKIDRPIYCCGSSSFNAYSLEAFSNQKTLTRWL